MNYDEFIAQKRVRVPAAGFEPGTLSPKLFPFQDRIVRWALRRGRAAIFADCGMGKTFMQLAWADAVASHTNGRVLILAPLAVGQQTEREGEKFGVDVRYRRQHTTDPESDRIVVTNYEMLDRFDTSAFAGVVLDESSILKSYDGKTRMEITAAFANTPYRLACTATPAPNDHIELATHAEFLGAMTRAEVLAMFFTHDGGETSKWRLKRHGQDAFWQWVCEWAVFLRKPSDIGFADDGYDLPALNVDEVQVGVPADFHLQRGKLFADTVDTLEDQRAARRATLADRVIRCAEQVNASPDQWIVWCELNDESDALRRAIPDAVEIKGSDDWDAKEAALLGFAAGKHRVLVTKPSIAGHGMNFQNCAHMAFVGIGHSYEQYYQAVRRCWRFGQTRDVHVTIYLSNAEASVLENVKRKSADADRMAASMVKHMKTQQTENISGTEHTTTEYVGDTVEAGKAWELHHGDCVRGVEMRPENSVDLSIFSPPFASLYTYSNSSHDMGNCNDRETFTEHFAFLVTELFRVTKPGRIVAVHCMDLPTSKANDGQIGLHDFRGDLIRACGSAGFIYHSSVCIWKDPVTAMQRTKALGLLHKQLKKDSCMSRQGIPDYLLAFRKPGDNPSRVSHTNESFPVSRWQEWASPIWTDIDPGDTLQYQSARANDDERHICPLQLEVIRRAMIMWSNPGDLVLDPFAGIGSTGHVAIHEGRRFLGFELKESYFKAAVRNLRDAESESGSQQSLFAEAAP